MSEPGLPLAGLRVVDLGIITAGAATSALLADLGAEVIKIESPTYLDPFRLWSNQAKVGQWWNDSPHFNFTNRGKKSVCMDIKSAKGRALLIRLLERSDVLVENFRRGVMERLGLDADNLRQINSRLVVAAVSAQGQTGGERMIAAFGSTLEATAGMAALAGFPDGPPVLTGRDMNYPDQVVALFAASMILTALHSRRRTGRGAFLDLSQRELTTFLLGETFATGKATARNGNGDPCVYLQVVEPAADKGWVAVTVADEDEARRLDLADEEALRGWVRGRSALEAVATLTAQGVAAAIILDGPAICASGWFSRSHALTRDAEGHPVKGFPFQFRLPGMAVGRPTPTLGQDTASVLTNVLGLDQEEIAALDRDGVIGEAPVSTTA